MKPFDSLPRETWKPCALRYLVSNRGRVASLIGKPKILKGNPNRDGYLMVVLFEGKPYTNYIHRLVYIAFKGAIPEGYEINHRDGDKTNNSLGNLEIVTHYENIKHAQRLGLRAAVSPYEVNTIHRLRFVDGLKWKDIAAYLGKAISVVWNNYHHNKSLLAPEFALAA
jgi:hypothetical protein